MKKTSTLHIDLPILSLSREQHELFHQIEETKNHYLIQGQAGTGKSTFIKYLFEHSSKRIRILCPTAIAALNIAGVTIHSLFRLPLSDYIVKEQVEIKKKTINILKKTDIIVIDEISMVRPDIIDTMDYILKQARGDFSPFGGVQMVFVGDLCQLPPVIKQTTSHIFKQRYGIAEPYFFDAKSFKMASFCFKEFKKVYRQSDDVLLKQLSNIREKKNLNEALHLFNKAKFENEDDLKTAITITPYRLIADKINQMRLAHIPSDEKTYEAKAKGAFEKALDTPAPKSLTLKVGALVIFNKNNPPSFINGSMGEVIDLQREYLKVRLLQNNKIITVGKEIWQSFSYEYDAKTDTVLEKETGSFEQFPIQLGYALTIHKAQGKTLDKVIIDTNKGAFAHGQMYVALSRTRKLKDIHLTKDIKPQDIILDTRVLDFLEQMHKITTQLEG
ncbi:MAG: AAA family ATPase [Alphaproteobacteria bacterium]|nr:AAA family ATPase [Alphaproteobacteria bacterium]